MAPQKPFFALHYGLRILRFPKYSQMVVQMGSLEAESRKNVVLSRPRVAQHTTMEVYSFNVVALSFPKVPQPSILACRRHALSTGLGFALSFQTWHL